MKKTIIAIVTSILILLIFIGGTYAATVSGTKVQKTISTSALNVNLHIEGDDKLQASDDNSLVANETVKQKVYAMNTGNKDIYLRIRVNKAWYLENKRISEKNEQNIDSDMINLNYVNDQDWIVKDNGDEDILLYYKKILKAGDNTSSFMDSFTVLGVRDENTNQYAQLDARITYDADAIQTTVANQAMLAEWGVNVTLDEKGNITGIENQK